MVLCVYSLLLFTVQNDQNANEIHTIHYHCVQQQQQRFTHSNHFADSCTCIRFICTFNYKRLLFVRLAVLYVCIRVKRGVILNHEPNDITLVHLFKLTFSNLNRDENKKKNKTCWNECKILINFLRFNAFLSKNKLRNFWTLRFV